MDDLVVSVIDLYRPRGVPPEAAVFARTVTAQAGPANVSRAKAWMFVSSRAGAFAMSIGSPLDPQVVLSAAMIERFILEMGPAVAVSTRRTVDVRVIP